MSISAPRFMTLGVFSDAQRSWILPISTRCEAHMYGTARKVASSMDSRMSVCVPAVCEIADSGTLKTCARDALMLDWSRLSMLDARMSSNASVVRGGGDEGKEMGAARMVVVESLMAVPPEEVAEARTVAASAAVAIAEAAAKASAQWAALVVVTAMVRLVARAVAAERGAEASGVVGRAAGSAAALGRAAGTAAAMVRVAVARTVRRVLLLGLGAVAAA